MGKTHFPAYTYRLVPRASRLRAEHACLNCGAIRLSGDG